MLNQAVQLDATPQLPDATAIPEGLRDLLEAKGYSYSWQRYDQRSMPLLRQFPGMRALTGSEIKGADKDLYAELFGDQSLLGLTVEKDLIRNGDLVLFIMPKSARDEVMDQDRERRKRQQGTKRNPAIERLADELRQLGIEPRGQRDGVQVAVHGYESAASAASHGVRRKTNNKTKED